MDVRNRYKRCAIIQAAKYVESNVTTEKGLSFRG